MLTTLSIITSAITLWALWTRRDTWHYRWEWRGTLSLAFLAVATLLTTPLGNPADHALHYYLHQWNLQILLIHIFTIGGMCAAVYSSTAKLTTDEEIRHWAETRLRYPALAAVTLMTILFTTNPRRDNPHMLTTPTPHLAAYWTVFAALVTYLLYHGLRALLDLWHDPPSRPTVDIHILAGIFITTAMLTRLIDAVLIQEGNAPLILDISYIAGCLASITYAIGVAHGWNTRIGWFIPLSQPENREYDDPQAPEERQTLSP